MDAYRQLKVQASNVYFLYHDESPAAADSNSADTFVFASRHVKEHNWVFRDFWRDGHLPLLLFALEHPDYDYFGWLNMMFATPGTGESSFRSLMIVL